MARDSFDQEIWWEPRCCHASLWYDNWTQLGALHYIMPLDHVIDENFEEVNQLRVDERWDNNLLTKLIDSSICDHVNQVMGTIQQIEENDKQWWMPINKGKFYVGSAFEIIQSRKDPHKDIMFIWERCLPFKFSFLMWRIWFQRIPIGEVLVKSRIANHIECYCCDTNNRESFNHLFVLCLNATYLWKLFAGAIGMQGPFIQLKQTIYKWWEEDCATKLKPLCRAVPSFIIWQLWKRRNIILHGGSMTRHTMVLEINRNIHLMAKSRYSWLAEMPNTWTSIVQFLENYTTLINNTMVRWKFPERESYKCNSDGSSLGSNAFCIKNGQGELVYVEACKTEFCSALQAKVKGFKGGLLYCLGHKLLPLTMETDSVTIKKILDGIWRCLGLFL
ncbi:uncharacterized protein [Solanum tuberosum]|uniref:uncharacterized protein n=1 Tax=Solanum tuberosum TaxID=4113 RepID=UPI00073A22D8|nr:PREDICTED: uncharacterized protein LOC107059959 [Solanum tuberosum]